MLVLATNSLICQDTLTVIHYNLLHYGNFTSYCTNINNNIDLKDAYLKTILNYVKPDIFTVNEMSSSISVQERMLNNNLNTEGEHKYKMANYINQAGSYIVNQLYYNTKKLALKSHLIAQSYYRDIDLYRLYYLSDDLIAGDTAFIVCVVAHLKSGNSPENANIRKTMVNNALSFLDSHDPTANYLFMGDFNTYTSNEACYQLLTNNSGSPLKFIDPIDTPGDWNNSYDFRYVHTQSTHADQNGCASYGGMDDRFDFILASENIMQGVKDVEYVEGSYIAIGQDGKHFNGSINDPPDNESAPEEVINALYRNSDHLPVSAKLKVDKTLDFVDNTIFVNSLSFANPNNGSFYISFNSFMNSNITIEIVNFSGRSVYWEDYQVFRGSNELYINENLPEGLYLMVLHDKNGIAVTKKMIVLTN